MTGSFATAHSVIDSAIYSAPLFLNLGAARICLQQAPAALLKNCAQLYPTKLRSTDPYDFSDFHISLHASRWGRQPWKKKVRFDIDGVAPFEPFPHQHAFPYFEWGLNWCIAQRLHRFLLLHAGALANTQQHAVLLSAPPGHGKSTLTAALHCRGLRLLSDEFGILNPAAKQTQLLPLCKPIALKNDAIRVIKTFAPQSLFGPIFAGTRKGDVAHLATQHSLSDVLRPAQPRLLLFPRYQPDSPLNITALPPHDAFAALAYNSFNYHILGQTACEQLATIVTQCPAYTLRYSDLTEACTWIESRLDNHNT